MVAEKVNDDMIAWLVHLLIGLELLVILNTQSGENELWQLCEDSIIVVLTDREVDIVASNHIKVDLI